MNEFMKDFKYYKSRASPPSLDSVLYFEDIDKNNELTIHRIEDNLICHLNNLDYGLKPLKEWKIYKVRKKNGLIFIKNPFLGVGQRYWISRCLKDYTKKPNKLNIDIHDSLRDGKEWWEECQCNGVMLRKLRWATLGFHHNWDTKIYNENDVTKFPDDLQGICKIIANAAGFENYLPQASIVNYYHMDSTLAPHTDHSEKYLDAPLISISFGQSAIFLIGGATKEEKPLALYLQSGDIVIMSKEARLSYHAVPRIIKADNQPWNILKDNITPDDFDELYDENKWKPFENYVCNSRININVRQVLQSELN